MNQHTSFLKRAVTLGVESVNNVTDIKQRSGMRAGRFKQFSLCDLHKL